MMNKLIVIAWLAWLGILGHCSGQDFQQALQDARQAYGNLERMHAVMQVTVYRDTVRANVVFSEVADIKKDRDYYRYHFGDFDMLMNAKYRILVNRAVREISISTRDVAAEKQFNDPMMTNLDTLQRLYDEVRYTGQKEGLQGYQLRSGKSHLYRTDLFFAADQKWLKKIVYYYRGGQLVSIVFNTFDQDPVFAPQTFSEQHYVSARQGSFKPVEAWAGYHVEDLTTKHN